MKVHTLDGQQYKLPNTLNDFQLGMYAHLINWKRRDITSEPGHHQGQEYDAILPDECVARQAMPHIYEPILKSLTAHRLHNAFRIHRHFFHMSSSQAANINLFLPILHNPCANAVLRTIKEDFESLATDQLDNGYCLEYWAGNFGADNSGKGLLGDKTPVSGTDADIAIAYRNHRGDLCVWLIEHKLVEAEFTACGGYKSKGRTDKERHDCTRNFSEILKTKDTCYYHDECRYRYWDITEANRDFFVGHAKHARCPFQGGMNQLWRNQLLAMAVEKEGKPFKHAHFSVVHHANNNALDSSLRAYRELIGGNPKFSVFTSAQVVRAAEVHGDDAIRKWATWYKDLYAI